MKRDPPVGLASDERDGIAGAVGWIVSRRLEVSDGRLLTRGSNEQGIGGRRHARRQDLVNRGNKGARRDKKWRCSEKVARRGEFGKGMTKIRRFLSGRLYEIRRAFHVRGNRGLNRCS